MRDRFGRCPGSRQTRRGSVLQGRHSATSPRSTMRCSRRWSGWTMKTTSRSVLRRSTTSSFITPRPMTRPRSGRASTRSTDAIVVRRQHRPVEDPAQLDRGAGRRDDVRLVLLAVAEPGTAARSSATGAGATRSRRWQRSSAPPASPGAQPNSRTTSRRLLALYHPTARSALAGARRRHRRRRNGGKPWWRWSAPCERASSCTPAHRRSCDRLRGWWHKRAIAHLDAVARRPARPHHRRRA